jgi:hypothetical protein
MFSDVKECRVPSIYASCPTSHPRVDKLAVFQAWLEGCGGWVNDRVEMRVNQSGEAGIFATKHLLEDSPIATVPWECIITPSEMREKMQQTVFGARLIQRDKLKLLPIAFLLSAKHGYHRVWRMPLS